MNQPDLKSSVEKLRSLDRSLSECSPNTIAGVYVAAVGFLALLKKEQALLQARRKESTQNPPTCPAPEETPAITAVLQDAKLFGSLLSCLRSSTAQETPGSAESAQAGRKRSHSVSEHQAHNKSFKLSHLSPVPGRKAAGLAMDLKSHKSPSMKLPVLAATILSVAFSHIDHWPVSFVEVYAADCFGARSWVDEEGCALLVENLKLVHGNNEQAASPNSQFLASAAKVAATYRGFTHSEGVQPGATRNVDSIRRPSLSSVSSMQKMERTVSAETVESTVRAQIPYETEVMDWETEEEGQQGRVVSATPGNLPKKKKRKKASSGGDSSSSSSGGEEEEVVGTSESNDATSEGGSKRRKPSPRKVSTNGSSVPRLLRGEDGLYPLEQIRLDVTLVRQRYFGENLDLANNSVHRCLLDRLEQKSRQNSGLLQTLPQFTAVPSVRGVVAENLSKWLQSPALAGLARKLFAGMVSKMKNVDPPLEEDVKAIDFILAMKLKANQFAAHMENLVAVATKIPTPTIAQQIFVTLTREFITIDSDVVQSVAGDLLKMIGGVHRALPASVANDAFAATLLTLLAEANENVTAEQQGKVNSDRTVLKLRQVIRALSKPMGTTFDTFQLMEALLLLDVNNTTWSVRNEEDKARLLFQCVTLHVSAASSGNTKATKGMDEPKRRETVRKTLHQARKSLLNWCCTDYGPRWKAAKKTKRREQNDDTKVGAGTPDYRSALGPTSGEEAIPTWLNTMRCLLFIEEANSELMTRFLAPSLTTPKDVEERERIKICCSYGADIDDDMVRIVLRAHGTSKESLLAEMAIQLLEHLFESCGRTRGTSLRVSDPDLVWELYQLAQYNPPAQVLSGKNLKELLLKEKGVTDEEAMLPRLAYPGFWWRATMLGLVMCGASPQKIGDVVWREHPTLRAMIKMVTASRYRFPTVDCDDAAKDEMKRSEQHSRETETQIAEFLFLPPKRSKKEVKNGRTSGSRTSRRIRKQQEEREAAAALAEKTKRKKMLKSAQKSIMLWDPDGPARKPPRESADLLVSVEEMFGLSDAFQRCTTPDLLLLTIGQTTRGAIERAYDWLIPVISKLPDLISRLPSSTSCFLLLRAYGSDSAGKSQLKELSAPLLSHVKESLRGKYGEEDCKLAFDLLMSDVAAQNAERRKSARRVLSDALGDLEGASQSTSWMQNVLEVDHSVTLVPSAIKHMSKAATFERGKVLKSLVLALREHVKFAEDRNIATETTFSALLARLISQRPSVFAEVIDAFPDLRAVTVDVLHCEIKGLAGITNSEEKAKAEAKIWLDLDGEVTEAHVSLDMLQASCVLLSIWTVHSDEGGEEKNDSVSDLVRTLLDRSDKSSPKSHTLGLAGARCVGSDDRAVPVESWIMLSKARDEAIGKDAALSAPEDFLARLLISSGLPRGSLLAMVDRLGKLGDNASNKDTAYRKLMNPSASSEWDLFRIGKHRDIVRKLVGRLSAYFRMGNADESVSTTFLDWLVKESKLQEKPTKRKKKKAKPEKPPISLKRVSNMFQRLAGPHGPNDDSGSLEGDAVPESAFIEIKTEGEHHAAVGDVDAMKSTLASCFKEQSPDGLDEFLHECVSSGKIEVGQIAATVFAAGSQHKQKWVHKCLMKWVPSLSKHDCPSELKSALFGAESESSAAANDVLRHCLLVWDGTTTLECQDWIFARGEQELSSFSASRMSMFLLLCLEKDTNEVAAASPLNEQQTKTACNIAIRGLEDFSKNNAVPSQRRDIPESLALLLELSKFSKKHSLLAGDMILSRLNALKDTPNAPNHFGSAFLRMYLLHPQWANTGNAHVRTVLLKAAELNEENWSCWISALDDLFDDLLGTLASGDTRVVKALCEQSRKYPLLVLRKSRSFVRILRGDAMPTGFKEGGGPNNGGNMRTTKIKGENLGGPQEAVMDGRPVRVRIRHWGYEFSEALWTGVLEIFCSVHKEVLFSSGQKLGFWALLEWYLQLLHVQLNLTTANATNKLNARIADILKTYREVNKSGYHSWLATSVVGGDATTEVRNVLVSLSLLTPQDAIDSLKAAPS